MEHGEIIELIAPLKGYKLIWDNGTYILVITDFNGTSHYFNQDGTYNGQSHKMMDGTLIMTSKLERYELWMQEKESR